ncbi:MAG: hypothetical protein B9S32_15275, partial [Verrucomicrobia bacterium Tous-C9LFEB]
FLQLPAITGPIRKAFASLSTTILKDKGISATVSLASMNPLYQEGWRKAPGCVAFIFEIKARVR